MCYTKAFVLILDLTSCSEDKYDCSQPGKVFIVIFCKKKKKANHLDFIFSKRPNVNMSVPFDLLCVCIDVRYLYGR